MFGFCKMKHLHYFVSSIVLACVVIAEVNQLENNNYIPPPPSKTFLPPLLDMAYSIEDFISIANNSQNEIFQEEIFTTTETTTIAPPETLENSSIEQNHSLNAELQSSAQFVSSDTAPQNSEVPPLNDSNFTRNTNINESLVTTDKFHTLVKNYMSLDNFSLQDQNIVSNPQTPDYSSEKVSEEYETEQQNLSFTTEQPSQLHQYSIEVTKQRKEDISLQIDQSDSSIKTQESAFSFLQPGQKSQELDYETEVHTQMYTKPLINQENLSQSSIQTNQPFFQVNQQPGSDSNDEFSATASLQANQQKILNPQQNTLYLASPNVQSGQDSYEATVQQSHIPTQTSENKTQHGNEALQQSASYPAGHRVELPNEASDYQDESFKQKTNTLASINANKQSENTPSTALQFDLQAISAPFQQTEANLNNNIAALQYVQQTNSAPVEQTVPILYKTNEGNVVPFSKPEYQHSYGASNYQLESPVSATNHALYSSSSVKSIPDPVPFSIQHPENEPHSKNNGYMLPTTQQLVQPLHTVLQSTTIPVQQASPWFSSSQFNKNSEHFKISQQAVPATYMISKGYSIIGSLETNHQLQFTAGQQLQQKQAARVEETPKSYTALEYQALYNAPIADALLYKSDGTNSSPMTLTGQINIPFTQLNRYSSNPLTYANQEIGTQYAKNGGYTYNP